jgi:vacuolar iron transporter family protein
MTDEIPLEDRSLEDVYQAAHHDHRHRSVASGGARAAVFGASDGLVSNVALILGVAAAGPDESVVLLAGISGLVAGAASMAAGEWISMRSQAELFERELRIEREAQRRNPELERLELAKIYESRGLEPELAMDLATEMMRDPEVALEVHAREELGIDPDELGSPWAAASSSFVAFGVGAVLPLLPWFIWSGSAGLVGSIVISAIGALVLGAVVGVFSGKSAVYAAFRQLAIAVLAALVTVGIGTVVGVSA